MTLIFHIAARDAALAARHSGEYRAESLSREGLIHFSGSHQLLDVAQRFYATQRGLVLLAVDPSLLKAELKYEAPLHPVGSASALSVGTTRHNSSDASADRDGSPLLSFPHLYGPLNFDAVVAVYDFEPDSSGQFSLPANLTSNI